MSFLAAIARMVGVRIDQAEDALVDDGRAQEAVRLSRRGFFAAGAVMAATPLIPERVYSFIEPVRAMPWQAQPPMGMLAWSATSWNFIENHFENHFLAYATARQRSLVYQRHGGP